VNLAATLDLFCQKKLERRLVFQGLNISVENDVGSTRRGVAPNGKKWATKMKVPYGYIRMTQGVDGDHVDCFVGPFAAAKNAYVVHVRKPPAFKVFDEDKVMLGFSGPQAAKKSFLEHYDGPEFFGGMDTLSMAKFKQKVLATKDRPAKIAAAFVLEAGGPGSGCNPEKGKCGRPRTKDVERESGKISNIKELYKLDPNSPSAQDHGASFLVTRGGRIVTNESNDHSSIAEDIGYPDVSWDTAADDLLPKGVVIGSYIKAGHYADDSNSALTLTASPTGVAISKVLALLEASPTEDAFVYIVPTVKGKLDYDSALEFSGAVKKVLLKVKQLSLSIKAEFPGEPAAGYPYNAHIEPHGSFHPPSARHPKHVPADNPGEKDDSVRDVKKRKAAETERWRTELTRRQPRPPGTVPVRTALQEPAQGISPMF
jgi:hypothetical protein